MDLSVISPFMKDIQINGRFNMNGEWEGLIGKPSVYGYINIADASVNKSEEPPLVEKINASVSFRDSMLILENASGVVSGTRLQ